MGIVEQFMMIWKTTQLGMENLLPGSMQVEIVLNYATNRSLRVFPLQHEFPNVDGIPLKTSLHQRILQEKEKACTDMHYV